MVIYKHLDHPSRWRLSKASDDTVIVQMLAFSQPERQLVRYLITMQEVGLTEVFLKRLSCGDDGRFGVKCLVAVQRPA